MIKIQVTYCKHSFVSLISSGHAKFAEEGKDIVCAAVSAILQGGVQALKDNESYYSLTMKKGYLEIKRIAPNMSEHDETVIETIITQLESIAQVSNGHVLLERKQK